MLSASACMRLEKRALDLLVAALPPETDLSMRNPVPEEIAKRIIANAKLVGRGPKLRDQVLIVLADYRDHAWTKGRLAREGERIALADLILGRAARRGD